MKCPRCGGEIDEKKNYCSRCGAELRPRDNSADETLRLPDLSGVPLGGQEIRRRETGDANRRRRDDRALKITFMICALAVIVALAVFLALTLSGGERVDIPVPDVEDHTVDTPPANYDDYDYDEPEDEPDEEDPREEPDEEPEEEPDQEPEEGGPEDTDPDENNDESNEAEPDEDDKDPEQVNPPVIIAEPDIRDEE